MIGGNSSAGTTFDWNVRNLPRKINRVRGTPKVFFSYIDDTPPPGGDSIAIQQRSEKTMVRSFVFPFLFMLTIVAAPAQQSHPSSSGSSSVSTGLLHGGGALIGVDLEYFLTDRIAVQAGGGIVGLGAAVNYHLESDVYSPAVSLQYWN